MKGGTFKSDASQRFDDFPGEQPSLGEVERWQQNARFEMTDDQKAVVRNKVPAKLLAETTLFDIANLPALSAGATEAMVASRAVTVANYTADNARARRRTASLGSKKSKQVSEMIFAPRSRRARCCS